MSSQMSQLDLFAGTTELPFMLAAPMPGGFSYQENFLSPQEEKTLLELFQKLPFEHATHEGYKAQRRMVWYAWQTAGQGPDWLTPFIARAAAFAGIPAQQITSALIQEYTPGSPIGWHRDKPTIGHVIGISLAGTCSFRLRRQNGTSWERFAIPAKPRSIYCMSGESRTDWQHSIPAVEELRYSITLRDF